MNKLDNDYKELLLDIMTNGVSKNDRTKTGTLSVFGRQIRHRMSDGFPIITTKKMYFKGIVTELIWFLRGDTNIKYLVDNDCHIWDGDVYKAYAISHIKQTRNQQEKMSSGWKTLTLDPYYLSKEEFINKIKTDDAFAKKWGELGPIYGRQWRSWNTLKWESIDKVDPSHPDRPMLKWNLEGIDQITNLINDLRTNPDSRRLMVSAWNVGELDEMVLPPCHYGFQVWTRELSLEERVSIFNKKKESGEVVVPEFKSVGDMNAWTNKLLDNVIPTKAISLMYNARSQDVPLGTPFNITSYALLLVILGKMVNMVPDELIANMGDCHIYSNQIDGVKEQLTRESYPLPTLKINSGNENWHLLELDEVLNTLDPSFTFKLENYQSHPTIKLPLSN